MAENLQKIVRTLSKLKPYMVKKYHVHSIGLFGSILRNDFIKGKSDIDIIVDFSEPIGIEFVELADFIENELKEKVDLVSKSGIKKRYLELIEPEIMYV